MTGGKQDYCRSWEGVIGSARTGNRKPSISCQAPSRSGGLWSTDADRPVVFGLVEYWIALYFYLLAFRLSERALQHPWKSRPAGWITNLVLLDAANRRARIQRGGTPWYLLGRYEWLALGG